MPDPEEITIIVHSASGLKSKLGGGHKFFVVFGLNETKYQTSVVVDTKGNPVWNEDNVVTVDNIKDEVSLVVREKDNVLGQIHIPVSEITGEKGQMQKQALQSHKKCKTPQGELTYQCFVSKYRDPNKPLVEENDNNNAGKKKFKVSFQRKESEKQLEKITEGDCESPDDPNEVEEITMEELVNQNAKNQNEKNDTYKNDENVWEKSTEKVKKENSNGLDQDSPVPLPRRHKKKNNKKVENGSLSKADKPISEEHLSDQETNEKNQKKRFSLKFLNRKKMLDETKKVLGKKNDKESPDNEYHKEETNSLDEILGRNSLILEAIDGTPEKNDSSAESLNSQGDGDGFLEKTEDSVFIHHTDDLYLEEKDEKYDVEMIDIGLKMNNFVIDDQIPGTSYQQSDSEAESVERKTGVEIRNENNKSYTAKNGKALDDSVFSNVPIAEHDVDGKEKKKKRFQLKKKNSGSDKSVSSSSSEGGKPPHLGTAGNQFPNSASPEKEKGKLKLAIPFIGADKAPPKIIKCTPSKSPVDEPTKVCIEGFSLGTSKSDILSLKLAGCDCLDTVQFETPEKIYCKTHFQFESRTGPVEIITKSGGQGILDDGFTFFDEIEKYTNKSPKSVTFPVQFENASPKHITEEEFDMRSTDGITSDVQLRPKMNRNIISKSSSETALTSPYVPHRFAEEQTESMFRLRQQRQMRRASESGLKPRRKAPPVPVKEDVYAKPLLSRRASDSGLKLKPFRLRETEGGLSGRRGSDVSPKIKKAAPTPPPNAVKAVRPVNLQLSNKLKSLTPVEEHSDTEKKEELQQTIKNMEEEKAAMQKEITRLKQYIDDLVSRVMERCPTALLQDNNFKTNLFL